MSEEKIATQTSGRARLLDNGDVFIEASDQGKMFRISRSRVRWEYVNLVSPETIGTLAWSSYIKHDELDLKWQKNLDCD